MKPGGMNIRITLLRENEIGEYVRLANSVFDEYVGKDYSGEGIKTFRDYVNSEVVLERMKGDNDFYIAKDSNTIIGILETRNAHHISLFFVDGRYQGKGIGRALFNHYISGIKGKNIPVISVNASIYGEKIYESLGFRKTAGLQKKNGILYIPMEYQLP